jgi:hypothetical protein
VWQNLFTQNVIAVIWDFDKTLSPEYMERPSFDRFGYLTRHILLLQQSRNRGARAIAGFGTLSRLTAHGRSISPSVSLSSRVIKANPLAALADPPLER